MNEFTMWEWVQLKDGEKEEKRNSKHLRFYAIIVSWALWVVGPSVPRSYSQLSREWTVLPSGQSGCVPCGRMPDAKTAFGLYL